MVLLRLGGISNLKFWGNERCRDQTVGIGFCDPRVINDGIFLFFQIFNFKRGVEAASKMGLLIL